MQGINFIAIDFETATGKRASICEAGICVVRDGEIVETRSWLVRPQGNSYSYWNMQIHGIRPNDTVYSPEFPEIWAEIAEYLKDIPVLVAHNAAFDIGCIRHSLELYGKAGYHLLLFPARGTQAIQLRLQQSGLPLRPIQDTLRATPPGRQ